MSAVESPRCRCYKEGLANQPDFEKVIEMKDAGVVIYRRGLQSKHAKGSSISPPATNTGHIFIIHNVKDTHVTSEQIMLELDQTKMSCPRCKQAIKHALNIFHRGPAIKQNEIMYVCDRCKQKTPSCYVCKKAIKEFFARNELKDSTTDRVRKFLPSINKILNKRFDTDTLLKRSEASYERSGLSEQRGRRVHTDCPCQKKNTYQKQHLPKVFSGDDIFQEFPPHIISKLDNEPARKLIIKEIGTSEESSVGKCIDKRESDVKGDGTDLFKTNIKQQPSDNDFVFFSLPKDTSLTEFKLQQSSSNLIHDTLIAGYKEGEKKQKSKHEDDLEKKDALRAKSSSVRERNREDKENKLNSEKTASQSANALKMKPVKNNLQSSSVVQKQEKENRRSTKKKKKEIEKDVSFDKIKMNNLRSSKSCNLTLRTNLKARPAGKDENEPNLNIDFEEVGETVQDEKRPVKDTIDIIHGIKVCKYKPILHDYPLEDDYEVQPILFSRRDILYDNMDEFTQTQSSSALKQPIKEDSNKGVLQYALSDRTFIEKGWTVLPTVKVTRKMNVYRMRPSRPEFDWFEHNKRKGQMLYDSGERLAEFTDDGRGRWYYKNGRLALDYYDAEEINAQKRFVIFSNGEPDERGCSRPFTILATFDYLGNGIVFDHSGKVRLKYNQTEGVVLDKNIGPISHWKWHSLNDPPVLHQVMTDTHMSHKDPNILRLCDDVTSMKPTIEYDQEMFALEYDNLMKEKRKKLNQSFKPFQIKMKALKINQHFSLKILDQASIYLIYRDGTTNLKLNIGMILDHKEIIDTCSAEINEVQMNIGKLPANSDSLYTLHQSVAYAQNFKRKQTDHERKIRQVYPICSKDQMSRAVSRPLRSMKIIDYCSCSSSKSTGSYSCRKIRNHF